MQQYGMHGMHHEHICILTDVFACSRLLSSVLQFETVFRYMSPPSNPPTGGLPWKPCGFALDQCVVLQVGNVTNFQRCARPRTPGSEKGVRHRSIRPADEKESSQVFSPSIV